MLEKYFKDLEEGLRKKLEVKTTARRKFVYEIGKIGGSRMFDKDWSNAWTTVFVPYEVLNSMGVSGLFIEFIGGMLASTGLGRRFLETAESEGYSTDSCSYHRSIIGAAIDGILPEPELLIGSTFPCNGGIKALKRIGEHFNKETFIINMPYECTPKSVDYVVKQYNEMIKYIQRQTGRELDYDKLTKTIELNNEARKYLVEAFELTKQIPCPANSKDLNNFIIFVLLSGTKEGVEVAKQYRDEFQNRIDKGEIDPNLEKHRLLWIQNRIQFKNNLIPHLEKKYSAKVVIDELNHIYWEPLDPKKPLESLAIRQITHPLMGPAERRIETLIKLAKEFKIDGAVNPAHWGCRQNLGARDLFKKAFKNEGIPMINLDVDCVDSRNYSEGQLLTRLEAFMEML